MEDAGGTPNDPPQAPEAMLQAGAPPQLSPTAVPAPGLLSGAVAEAAPVAEDMLGALKSIAEVGTLFIGLSFVGGWSYMASYYLAFGLNPSELDISVPATCAFAIHLLRRSGWPLPAAAVLLLGLVLFNEKLGTARRAWAGACVAVLFFAVAMVGSWRGQTLAAEDMFERTPQHRLPNVGFTRKTADPVAKLPATVAHSASSRSAPSRASLPSLPFAAEPECLTRGKTDCKLLLHAKGQYYFFEPFRGRASQSTRGGNLSVYVIPDSEVTLINIVRGVE